MRKPNYRFERAERDRAKKAKNDEQLQRRQKGPRPATTALPNRPWRTSHTKRDRRPPVSHSDAATPL